jgi:hypothetical protein
MNILIVKYLIDNGIVEVPNDTLGVLMSREITTIDAMFDTLTSYNVSLNGNDDGNDAYTSPLCNAVTKKCDVPLHTFTD